MKRLTALFLSVVLLLSLCACGKSEAAKAMDETIKSIGTVSLESEEAIVNAEKMYEALTEEQKAELDNYALLVAARSDLDKLIADSIPTKEEMLSVADNIYGIAAKAGIDVDLPDYEKLGAQVYHLGRISNSNAAGFKLAYQDKICTITGYVFDISDEYCELSHSSKELRYDCAVKVYLGLEDLAQLKKGEAYKFVGRISKIGDTLDDGYGVTRDIVCGITDAYVIERVENWVEITGELRGKNTGVSYDKEPPYNIMIDNNPYLKLIYFADGVDTSDFMWGDVITFKAQLKDGRYINATVISIE